MEDKLFDLMSKMYSELTGKIDGLQNKMLEFKEDTNKQFDSLNQKVDNLSNQLTRLEHEVKNDISSLYDGYKLTYEKLTTLEEKVDDISTKVDKQEIELRVVKGGK